MSTARIGCGVAVVENMLYAIGGFDGTNYLNTVERYDPAKNSWETVAAMSTPRRCPGAVAYDGMLVVMGGAASENSLVSSIERYSPASNSWEALDAVMSSPRAFFGCASM